jgi:hypothetical protein
LFYYLRNFKRAGGVAAVLKNGGYDDSDSFHLLYSIYFQEETQIVTDVFFSG